MYELKCGHKAYKLPDTVRKAGGEEKLRCAFCDGKPSQLMQDIVRKLEGVNGLGEGLQRVAFESVPIAELPEKRVDMYVPELGIAVEGDGRHHFHDSHHGKPAWQQYGRDRAFDEVCEAAQQRLVRLHYRDEHEWAGLIEQAIEEANNHGGAPFVMCTSSYKAEAERWARGLL